MQCQDVEYNFPLGIQNWPVPFRFSFLILLWFCPNIYEEDLYYLYFQKSTLAHFVYLSNQTPIFWQAEMATLGINIIEIARNIYKIMHARTLQYWQWVTVNMSMWFLACLGGCYSFHGPPLKLKILASIWKRSLLYTFIIWFLRMLQKVPLYGMGHPNNWRSDMSL